MSFPETCDCNPDRAGLDCFVEKNTPPNLFYLGDNGLCDLRVSPCNLITVYNNNTEKSSLLKCQLRKLQVCSRGCHREELAPTVSGQEAAGM